MFCSEEEDEETAEWEQEQLRRGGHLRSESGASTPSKAKQTYKPAPSKMFESFWYIDLH